MCSARYTGTRSTRACSKIPPAPAPRSATATCTAGGATAVDVRSASNPSPATAAAAAAGARDTAGLAAPAGLPAIGRAMRATLGDAASGPGRRAGAGSGSGAAAGAAAAAEAAAAVAPAAARVWWSMSRMDRRPTFSESVRYLAGRCGVSHEAAQRSGTDCASQVLRSVSTVSLMVARITGTRLATKKALQ
jgi:hypothetical protein